MGLGQREARLGSSVDRSLMLTIQSPKFVFALMLVSLATRDLQRLHVGLLVTGLFIGLFAVGIVGFAVTVTVAIGAGVGTCLIPWAAIANETSTATIDILCAGSPASYTSAGAAVEISICQPHFTSWVTFTGCLGGKPGGITI
jgi:hypothetical protein